jgi:antagonist of KipI
MRVFEVLHPGIYTTLQDLGRPGFMKYGIPASGAADRFSARVANWLAGNPAGAALLETTLFRLELLAVMDLVIAITGGDLSPRVNGNSIPMWQSISVRKGDSILFQARKDGLRAYLAVRGGFTGPVFLGSRSVFVRGLMGKPLEAGDRLEVEEPLKESNPVRKLPEEMIPSFPTRQPLRVVLGPQEDRFTPLGIETFLSSDYRVSHQSDRMGYRLGGPKIEQRKGADIISEPISRGAIQVPGDGLPILLLWDAQVSGGYTKIGSIISADLDRLAQVMPGETLRFSSVSLEEAHRALREENIRLERIQRILEEQR